MFTKLRLERFKGFKEAELSLGPFTLLVGVNASGKSNIRDAFRFLHGVGRGYSLAEIFGEKWGEGGELQWRGIRGGARGAAFAGANTFKLDIAYTSWWLPIPPHEPMNYHLEVAPGLNGKPPRLASERLAASNSHPYIFDSGAIDQSDSSHLLVRFRGDVNSTNKIVTQDFSVSCNPHYPALAQLDVPTLYVSSGPVVQEIRTNWASHWIGGSLLTLKLMRFFDPNPEVMRLPSAPGLVIGDRGENLAAGLQAVCEDSNRKRTLLRWLQELTPMDAADLEFAEDPSGKIHLLLIEQGGQKTSAASASDGTLRFLALLAALLGPEQPKLYFIEEIENGIHPTRLPLLLELFERIAAERNIQIVATTHSPQLLTLVRPQTLEYAALTYRLEGRPDAQVRRILDIPDAKTVLEQTDAGRLLASGWLENAVSFAEPVAEAG